MKKNTQESLTPDIKKCLFMYTGIIFSFHLGLFIIAHVLGIDIGILPFIYIPKTDFIGLLISIPFALVFDFVLSVFLLLLTLKKGVICFDWVRRLSDKKKRRSNIVMFVFLAFIFLILIYFYVQYQTVFVCVITYGGVKTIYKSFVGMPYSAWVLITIAIAIVWYALRTLLNKSVWGAIFPVAILVMLTYISRIPFQDFFKQIQFSNVTSQNVSNAFKILYILVVISLTASFAKSLVIYTFLLSKHKNV
jgi:hypothetical protein